MVFPYNEVRVDITQLAFTYKQHPLRARLIDAVAWYDLTDLCTLLGRASLEDATAFVASAHPQRLCWLAGDADSSPWVDDDGLWSIVSLAGYRFTDDLAQWLHLVVAPEIRHAMYEQAPNGNTPEVRELWHVIDQLLDIGLVRDHGCGTERLAINLAETMLAALRRGLPLPSKARLNRLLAQSNTPAYLGRMRITHSQRQTLCLIFERV